MTESGRNSFWYLWFKAVGDRRGYFPHSGLVRTCRCPSAGYDLHTPRNMMVPALFESYHLFRFGEELQLYENNAFAARRYLCHGQYDVSI